MDAIGLVQDEVQTNFTETLHHEGYAAISPTRPALSQAGRTVLVTGGGTGVGKAIAENFGRAGAATVLLVGRHEDVLRDAAAELAATARVAGSSTTYVVRVVDVTVAEQVRCLWAELAAEGVTVDVLVLNAAKFAETKTLFETGIDGVWSQFETNVKGPLHMAELFSKQPGDQQRFLQYVTTTAINLSSKPLSAARPCYILSKMSGTYAFCLVADSVQSDKMLVLCWHPGLLYNHVWEPTGITKDMLQFDEYTLPGQFSVWATSNEARFLHGRIVFSCWDVNELAGEPTARLLTADPDYLRPGIIGLKGGLRTYPL